MNNFSKEIGSKKLTQIKCTQCEYETNSEKGLKCTSRENIQTYLVMGADVSYTTKHLKIRKI